MQKTEEIKELVKIVAERKDKLDISIDFVDEDFFKKFQEFLGGEIGRRKILGEDIEADVVYYSPRYAGITGALGYEDNIDHPAYNFEESRPNVAILRVVPVNRRISLSLGGGWTYEMVSGYVTALVSVIEEIRNQFKECKVSVVVTDKGVKWR